ncbi:MAG: Unknown protein [uncultured Sulfurovum sp.]|uniref:Large polyvalent protein-associated domain-containing protein n=1 Tax=uncultured Sulfurovum sp. TaxID=269237 RepID=A0A6S6SWA2_9BACT|nr:MAG: Unknown protein [uncultured Sulfurovum sp.]
MGEDDHIGEKYHNIGLVSGDSAYEKRNRLKINTINAIVGKNRDRVKLKIPTPKTLKELYHAGFNLNHLYNVVGITREFNAVKEKTSEMFQEVLEELNRFLSPSQDDLNDDVNSLVQHKIDLEKQELYEIMHINPALLLGEEYGIKAEDLPYLHLIEIKRQKMGENEYNTTITEPSSKESITFRNQGDIGLKEAYRLIIEHRINHINAQISQGKKALERSVENLEETIDIVKEKDEERLLDKTNILRQALHRKSDNTQDYIEDVNDALQNKEHVEGTWESIVAHRKEVNDFLTISEFIEDILPQLDELHTDITALKNSFSASEKDLLRDNIDEKSALLEGQLMDKIGHIRASKYDDMSLFSVIKKDDLYHLCFKVTKDKNPTLKTFQTEKEAEDYLFNASIKEKVARFNEISTQIEDMRGRPLIRPRENEIHSRIGDDYSKGVNVSQEELLELGAAGIEYGVTTLAKKGEAREKINMLHDAIKDMAKVLKMDTSDLLLAKGLSISLGGRGIGGRNAPKAHIEYTEPFPVINLTRHSGDGSLAHELIHGLDFHTNKIVTTHKGDAEDKFIDAKSSLLSALKETDMYEHSSNKDAFKKKDYWSTDHEMLARAGESWLLDKIEEKGESNAFLVSIEASDLYPSKKDKKLIFPEMEKFMESVVEISKKHNPQIGIENSMIINAKLPAIQNKTLQKEKDNLNLFSEEAAAPAPY